MRHFLPQALAVPPLPLRVPPRTRGRLLVSATSDPQRCPPLLSRTLWPAVQVAPVASPTQHDEPPAPSAQESSKSSLLLVDGVATPPPTPACLPAIDGVPSPRRSSSDLTVIFDTERCGLPNTAALTFLGGAPSLTPSPAPSSMLASWPGPPATPAAYSVVRLTSQAGAGVLLFLAPTTSSANSRGS